MVTAVKAILRREDQTELQGLMPFMQGCVSLLFVMPAVNQQYTINNNNNNSLNLYSAFLDTQSAHIEGGPSLTTTSV